MDELSTKIESKQDELNLAEKQSDDNFNDINSMIKLSERSRNRLSSWVNKYEENQTYHKSRNILIAASPNPDFSESNEEEREYEEKKSILEGKITNYLVVGNGFDIACNAKTTFKKFLFFVVASSLIINYVKSKQITNYKEFLYTNIFHKVLTDVIENLRIKPEAIDTLEQKLKDFRSNKFCLNILCNVFPSVTDVTVKEFEWVSDGLGDDLKDFTYFIDVAHTYFSDNWEDENSKQNRFFCLLEQDETKIKQYENWLDVERFIKKMATESNCENVAPSSSVNNVYKKNSFPSLIDNPSEIPTCYDGINVFLEIFKLYLENEQKIVFEHNTKISIKEFFEELSKKHVNSVRNRSSLNIDSINLSKMNYLINYNYTNIAEIFLVSSMSDLRFDEFRLSNDNNFSKVDAQYNKMFHVNGSINLLNVVKNSMVLGYYNESDSSVQNAVNNTQLYPFEKIYQRIIKNVPFFDLDGTMSPNDLYDVIIYGHSCSDTDGDILKKILEDERLHIAIILCIDMKSMIDCFTNIANIVSKDKLNNLLSREFDKYKNFLYFSIEGEEPVIDKSNYYRIK